VRYAQGGGLTDAERTTRERLRLQAVERFEGGQKNAEIAAALRISVRSVERWRRAWREGGEAGVLSKGSPGRPRLSDAQIARLERELERGPLAHGWADQRWTLARIKTLIGRLFHVSYTVEGTWRLLKRHGWSWQQPTRRAIERDDDAVDLATGQLLCVDLETGLCELVNAGHPRPLLLRDNAVEEVELAVNLPFGVAAPAPYRLQELQLRPGDRLVLLTDGMQERGAAAVDLASVVHDTRALHPREAVRSLIAAVLDACHGNLKDDATVLLLDWHSNRSRPAETRPDPQR
jgi:transposase